MYINGFSTVGIVDSRFYNQGPYFVTLFVYAYHLNFYRIHIQIKFKNKLVGVELKKEINPSILDLELYFLVII